jgi:chromosome segregation ATPase
MKAKIETKPDGQHYMELRPDTKEDELLLTVIESMRVIDRLEEELAVQKSENDGWMKQNEYLVEQSSTARLIELDNEIIQLKASLAHMEDQRNAAYKRHNDGLYENDWYSAYTSMAKNATKWKQEYDQVKQENAELNDRLRTHKDVIAHLEEQRNNLKNDIAAGSEALDQLNKEVISLRGEKSKELEYREKLVRDRDELGKENAELKRQLAAMTETLFATAPKKLPFIERNFNTIKLFGANGMLVDQWDLQYAINVENMANTIMNAFTIALQNPSVTKDENDLP